MGNEAGKEQETAENPQEQTQKDEIPADSTPNNQYIESPNSKEQEQNKEIIKMHQEGPNRLIIREKKYETNEDGVHTKVDERRVEYHIKKINQEQEQEDEQNEENIEYDENVEQMEENAEGDYEINPQDGMENEVYQEQGEYITEQVYGNENQNEENYDENADNLENYAEFGNSANIIINKSNSTSEGYDQKNIRIINKDNLCGCKGTYTSSYYGNIPQYMSFQKAQIKGSGNIRSSLNVVKSEDASELIEIPRSEYPSYAGRETVFIGGGMETGEYKFKGQGIVITQKGSLEEKVTISEEEILNEINRRKNKPRKEKRKRYEILDKFYAITEFEGKPIIKTEKMEQLQKQYEYNQQMKISASEKGSAAFEYSSEHYKNLQSSNNDINADSNAQFQKMKISQYQQSHSKSGEQLLNINADMISNSIRFKDLDTTLLPGDNFSKLLLSKINTFRSDPQSYISTIENAKNKIATDKRGRLYYNGKYKIALARGEQAFDDAINILKTAKPADKLIFNPYLTVEMPKTEYEIRFKNDLKNKVESLTNKGIIIKSFWRDVINDPEISFLMTIIDDTGDKSGMRRRDLLDPNMKYIGINSIEINGCFVCYIILSQKD